MKFRHGSKCSDNKKECLKNKQNFELQREKNHPHNKLIADYDVTLMLFPVIFCCRTIYTEIHIQNRLRCCNIDLGIHYVCPPVCARAF